MTKLIYLALLPLLSMAARAQAPVPDPSRLAAVEQSDRAFLSNLEQQPISAPVPPPSPPPVAVAPAPRVAAAPRTVTKIEPARPVAPVKAAAAKPKAKSTVATAHKRSTPERRATVSRDYADVPTYRGIPVLDSPEVARVIRRSGISFRPIEIRRPVIIRKVTTTTVTSRGRDDDDDDRDEDEDDD